MCDISGLTSGVQCLVTPHRAKPQVPNSFRASVTKETHYPGPLPPCDGEMETRETRAANGQSEALYPGHVITLDQSEARI